MKPLASSTCHLLTVVVLATFLGGCVEGDISDLEAYVERIKNEEPLPLTPLPPFPPERVVLFSCEKENPFENFNKRQELKSIIPQQQNSEEPLPPGRDCEQPDIYRNKQPLERFPLDSLVVVGTITINGEIYGLVQEPEKKHMIHRVRVNDRLGENYGRIIAITDRQIDVVEMIPVEDEIGVCYQEQMRTISITDTNRS